MKTNQRKPSFKMKYLTKFFHLFMIISFVKGQLNFNVFDWKNTHDSQPGPNLISCQTQSQFVQSTIKECGTQNCEFKMNIPPSYMIIFTIEVLTEASFTIGNILVQETLSTLTPVTKNNIDDSSLININCQTLAFTRYSIFSLQQSITGPDINVKIFNNDSARFFLVQLKVDVLLCHPSCLTCSGPSDVECLTCSFVKIDGKCRCLSKTDYFDQGQCKSACSTQYFYQEKNCLPIYKCKSQNIDASGMCKECFIPYLLWDGICVKTCPVTFINLKNQNKCIDSQDTSPVSYYLKGQFWQTDFSDFSVNMNKIVILKGHFFQDSFCSKCGSLNLIGGFYINQQNTTIQLPEINVTDNFLQISFQYVLIDYVPNASSPNTGISIRIGSFDDLLKFDTSITGINLCGLSGNEYVGVYSYTVQSSKISSRNFKVNIRNNMTTLSSTTAPNDHPYFGIREISIKGSSQQFRCTAFSLTGCLICSDGYYLDAGRCLQCQPNCAICTSSGCSQCANTYQPVSGSCLKIPTSKFNQTSANLCEKCTDTILLCSEVKSIYSFMASTMTGLQSDDRCLVCDCQKCTNPTAVFNSICVKSCYAVGENYELNPSTGKCQCSSGFPLQYYIQPNWGCYSSQPIGYVCDTNYQCLPCSSDCAQCKSQLVCIACSKYYYLWQDKCQPQCFPPLNIIENTDKGICECKLTYIEKLRNQSDIQADTQFADLKTACFLILRLESVEIINQLQSGSSGSDSSSITGLNYFNLVYNRPILDVEFADFSILIDKNIIQKGVDYSINNYYRRESSIVVEVTVFQNRKISELTVVLDGSTSIIKVQNTILITKEMAQKISKSSSGQNVAGSMGSASSVLSSSDSSLSSVVLFCKWLQMLSKVSNFVQVLPLIYLLSNSLPSSVKYGSLLGVSFIFTGMPSPNAVDFQVAQHSETLRNLATNVSQQHDSSLIPRLLSASSQNPSELIRLLQTLGLSSNIFSNYIFIHLSVIISTLFIAFCMIFRKLLEGKQYTVVLINIISNIMASSLQSALIIILFSWAYSFTARENLVMTVFYLIVYSMIYIELIYITCSKSSEYLQDNIPNYFQDINSKAKGAKSYLLVSFFKKHLVISLNLILLSSPFPCAIIIACIFFANSVYILYFRFFIYYAFNFIKALQELLLCSLYCLLAKTIQDQQNILNKTVISDDDLMQTVYEGGYILYLMMVCIGFSFCIFIFRLIISAKQTYKALTKKKERKFNIFLDPILLDVSKTIETSNITTKNFKSKLDDDFKFSTQSFNIELQVKLGESP